MGKGDKRSFKGKVYKGSYGKTRPRHKPEPATPAVQGTQQQQQKRK